MGKARVKESGKIEGRTFFVSSDDHGPADVAAAAGRGERLRWVSPEKFFPLTDEIIRDLGHENHREYLVTEGIWKALKASPGEGMYGELDIIQLHSDNPRGRKAMDAPEDVHIFYPTVEQAHAALSAGYKYVDTRDTAFKPKIPMKAPTDAPKDGEVPPENRHYTYNRETGKAEHVAMWIPEVRFQKHIHAIAAKSQARIGENDKFVETGIAEQLEKRGVRNAESVLAGVRATSSSRDEKEVFRTAFPEPT